MGLPDDLRYTMSEASRIEAEARDAPMSDTVAIPRDVADKAIKALRAAKVGAIAHYSDEPYPDDPRWTPWTRFGQRIANRCDDAEHALRAAIAATGEQS